MKKCLIALFAASMLTACSGDKVSFDTLETSRSVAKDNASFNAAAWRTDTKTVGDLYVRGDSTQDRGCPQGDGWASVDVLDPDSKAVIMKLKCSTASAVTGCMSDSDFKSRSYASEEGRCNKELPAELKRFTK